MPPVFAIGVVTNWQRALRYSCGAQICRIAGRWSGPQGVEHYGPVWSAKRSYISARLSVARHPTVGLHPAFRLLIRTPNAPSSIHAPPRPGPSHMFPDFQTFGISWVGPSLPWQQLHRSTMRSRSWVLAGAWIPRGGKLGNHLVDAVNAWKRRSAMPGSSTVFRARALARPAACMNATASPLTPSGLEAGQGSVEEAPKPCFTRTGSAHRKGSAGPRCSTPFSDVHGACPCCQLV